MAVIGSIRKRSGLLVGAIGVAMLLFILNDLLSSNSVFLNGQNQEIGEINGNKLSYQEFAIRVDNIMAQRYPNGANEEARQAVREEVWKTYMREQIMDPQFEALGLSVSDEELISLIKNNPNYPMLRRYFSNQNSPNQEVYEQFRDPVTGGVKSDAVLSYLQRAVYSLDTEADQTGKLSWLSFEKSLRGSIVDDKFSTLVQKGLYATRKDAELENKLRNDKVTISFVTKAYSSIPDEDVTVSDADISSYYNAHKNEYKEDKASRAINYIAWDIEPSDMDFETAEAELANLKTAFSNTDNDTIFIRENADTPFNIRWAVAGEFNPAVDSTIQNAAVGTIVGPFLSGEAKYEMVKVKAHKTAPDSAKARHILITYPQGTTDTATAMAKIDSIKLAIENGTDFAELAAAHSDDPGSKNEGGDLGWFREGQMVKEFNDACFNGEQGKMYVVSTQFGVHLIEVAELTDPVAKTMVAIVDNEVEVGDATYESLYAQASSFAIQNNTLETFESNGESMGIVRIPAFTSSEEGIMNLDNSREIVRWAFKGQEGDVSEPFTLADKFVVAAIREARPEGIQPLDKVREDVKLEVIKEKKGEMLQEQLAGKTDLDQLAVELNTSVQKIPGINLQAFQISNLGVEPKLQGLLFTMNQGDVSVPIAGNQGIYVVRIDQVTPAGEADYATMNRTIESSLRARVGYEAYTAIQENAEIVDNRGELL